MARASSAVTAEVADQEERQSDAPTLGRAIRAAFPIFGGERPPAYLDTAATCQRPQVVIDRLQQFLSFENANIHRGAYALSATATESYESARGVVAGFFGVSAETIVFVRGTTEGINLVASALDFRPGEVILSTVLEHHSNIVPWQLAAQRTGATTLFVDLCDDGQLDLDDVEQKLEEHRPRLLAVTMMSNAFGTTVDIAPLVRLAHQHDTLVLVDIAQAAAHQPLNLRALGVDFAVCSGHKLYGPTGIGALYVRPDRYDLLRPYQGGGGMIRTVSLEGATWAEPPHRFEAGTPAIAEAVAFATAVELLQSIGMAQIARHEEHLTRIAEQTLRAIPGVTLHGPGSAHGQRSIFSFSLDGVHPHDLATIADGHGVQLRAGHHCAMPALRRLGLPATARASLGIYSDVDHIERLAQALEDAKRIFSFS